MKAATVFIRNRSTSGSGFLVRRRGKHGLIVTNRHVVRGIPIGRPVEVIFNSGQLDQRPMRGLLEAAIPRLDLALIQVEANDLPDPIARETRSPVHETEPLLVLGFPFGSQLATNRATPRLSISSGIVTSLRSDLNDQTMYIQTDAAINPGNSGGPVVDQSGHLIGVTVAKIENTSISFIIPRRRLDQLMAGLLYDIDLRVERKWLDSERWVYQVRGTGRAFTGGTTLIQAGLKIMIAAPETVRAALQSDQSWQEIHGKKVFDLKLHTRTTSGDVFGHLDLPSSLAGKRLVAQPYLTYLHRQCYQPPLRLELEPGGKTGFLFEGPNRSVSGKDYAEIRSNRPTHRPAARQPRMEEQNPPEARYAIRRPEHRRSRRARRAMADKVIMLPGSIDSVALVGGGRYLAFGVDADKSLALLDLKRQRLIPLDLQLDEPALVTGDASHIYIAGADSGKLISWSLSKKRVVKKGFSPDGRAISAIASGWNADNHTLLVITRSNIEILDTHTFRARKLKWESARYHRERRPNIAATAAYRARASGNGKVFTFWQTAGSPAGVELIHLRGTTAIHYNLFITAGFVVPDASGRHIYTSLKGAYTTKLEKIEDAYLKGGQLIPSISGKYILRVNYQNSVRASLIRAADGQLVDTLRIPELQANKHPYSYHRDRPNGDQRFWLRSDNKALFVIPDSNDRVVVHKLKEDT